MIVNNFIKIMKIIHRIYLTIFPYFREKKGLFTFPRPLL